MRGASRTRKRVVVGRREETGCRNGERIGAEVKGTSWRWAVEHEPVRKTETERARRRQRGSRRRPAAPNRRSTNDPLTALHRISFPIALNPFSASPTTFFAPASINRTRFFLQSTGFADPYLKSDLLRPCHSNEFKFTAAELSTIPAFNFKLVPQISPNRLNLQINFISRICLGREKAVKHETERNVKHYDWKTIRLNKKLDNQK